MNMILFRVFITLISISTLYSQRPLDYEKSMYWGKNLTLYLKGNDRKYTGEVYSKHPNGNIKTNGYLLNGKRDGEWTIYYQDGKVRCVGMFRNSLPNGIWGYHDPLGNFYSGNIIYKNNKDKISGTGMVLIYSNGSQFGEEYIYEVIEVEDNIPNGRIVGFQKDGSFRTKGEYRNGKKHGTWVNFQSSGKVQERKEFKLGVENGHWEKWYSNGNKMWDHFYHIGRKEDVWIDYYEDGTKKEQNKYLHGHPWGEHIEWYKNGNIKEQWYEYTSVEQQKSYRDSSYSTWYENGRPKESGFYTPRPDSTSYSKYGEWKYHDSKGNLQKLEQYNRYGQLDGRYIEYYSNGKPSKEGFMKGYIKDSEKIGEWKFYNPDGSLMSSHKY